MKPRPQYLIESLRLSVHPEGGFFCETYRSPVRIPVKLLKGYTGDGHSFSTAIYFLLVHPGKSAFHRLRSDELWHFHEGSPVIIYMIDDEGRRTEKILGPGIEKGESYQAVIPSNTWFAADVMREGEYTLVGCTVAPGFDFNDFEPGDREDMIGRFPSHAELITRFTSPHPAR